MLNFNYFIKLSTIQKLLIVTFFDCMIAISSNWIAIMIRYEKIFYFEFIHLISYIISLTFLLFFFFFNIYRSVFRFINLSDLRNIINASVLYSISFFFILYFLNIKNFPAVIGIIQPVLFCFFVLISRISLVAIFRISNSKINVVVYGAGNTGYQLSNTIINSKKYNLVGFIDDDNSKINRKINNKKIYNLKNNDIKNLYGKVDLFIIAIGKISKSRRKEIVESLDIFNAKIKSVPNIDNFVDSNLLNIDETINIELEDIIDKKLNNYDPQIDNALANQVILVTGAGGSIGSELSLQILKRKPKILINLDNSELNLYNLEKKLSLLSKKTLKKTEIVYSLTNVVDKSILINIFKKYSPKYIFHAAAYKHVSIVENNIIQAITNNIIGTYNLLDLSNQFHVKNFTLVSTDKAVNPTSVMGKTKRISELLVQAFAEKNGTASIMSIVRFGNVLDSSGSVIPLFRDLIKSRSPIPITHPEVTRYFMLIPEAVNLILSTIAMSKGGEVFVLNMGEPIKILDLAKQMIKLSNLKIEDNNTGEEGDIRIEFIGLRKGEKLHEELIIGENYELSSNNNIYIAYEEYIPYKILINKIEELISYSFEGNEVVVMETIDNILNKN